MSSAVGYLGLASRLVVLHMAIRVWRFSTGWLDARRWAGITAVTSNSLVLRLSTKTLLFCPVPPSVRRGTISVSFGLLGCLVRLTVVSEVAFWSQPGGLHLGRPGVY